MLKTKYIVFETSSFPIPIIFPETINHNDMASMINLTPISAGFCEINNNKFFCYGRSESLNLDSNPNDSRILNFQLNNSNLD